MPKHDGPSYMHRQFSAISEEKSFDYDQMPWLKKAEEMEIIQSLLSDESHFTVIEEPDETQVGSFRIRLSPNCGMELAGCFIELEMSYLEVESMENYIQILPETAEGLTSEQIEELDEFIMKKRNDESCTASEIIEYTQDFLGNLNSHTRKVIQLQVAVENEKEQRHVDA